MSPEHFKARLAVAALVAVAALSACGEGTAKKAGVINIDATTTTTVASTTTATSPAKATSSTTATTAKATTTSTAGPTTTTTRAVSTTTVKTVSYANCTAVKDAGKAPLYRGDPGYASHLDRDDDGVACET
jgi:excalibur calcium-binding domain-containing protein